MQILSLHISTCMDVLLKGSPGYSYLQDITAQERSKLSQKACGQMKKPGEKVMFNSVNPLISLQRVTSFNNSYGLYSFF